MLYLSCVGPASQSLEYIDQSTGGTGYSPTDLLRGFKCLDLYLIFHTAARVAFLKYSWIPSTE